MKSRYRKLLVSPLVSLLLLCPPALSQDRLGPLVPAPEGVVRVAPTAEQEMALAEALEKALAPDSSQVLPGDTMTVDPFMWDWLREDPAFQSASPVKLDFNVRRLAGSLRGIGQTLGEPAAREAVTRGLRSKVQGDFTVRRANAEEMNYLWALYPFDLEGPLLTVEAPTGRWIFLKPEEILFAFQLPSEPAELNATLEALGQLPLSQPEPDILSDNLMENPEFTMPVVTADDPLKLTLFTDDQVFQARVEGDVFKDYVVGLLEAIASQVPEGSGPVLAQVSVNAKGQSLLFVKSPVGEEALKLALAGVPTPKTRGPIAFVLAMHR